MKITKISKFLSLILRHKPEVIGLTLDNNGWADVKELLDKMIENDTCITFDELCYVVETNNKQRFAFNEDNTKIRANQGHSIDVDLELLPIKPPDNLYHGTATKNLESIIHNGIIKGSRQYVHLSKDHKIALMVGSRHGIPYIFTVNAKAMYEDGKLFYKSKNGVWLTDYVDTKYLIY